MRSFACCVVRGAYCVCRGHETRNTKHAPRTQRGENMAINEPISRRTFLRGVGTVMALPMLEAMLPLTAMAQTADKMRPNRMAFIFVPNGINMKEWRPAVEGTGFELPSVLQPLKNVKNDLNVLSRLAQHNAFALGDCPGDHARSTAAWLTASPPPTTPGSGT